MPTGSRPSLRQSWFVWGLGALLYLTGFFHRVAPAVMTAELMREFRITAAALGNLSALYFYSYVAMQIPTGIMADRLGPRRLLSAGAVVAALGTLLFASSDELVWAGTGRLLIGGSVAVAFVGLLKVANNWFPPRYYAMVSGMALFVGIIGAVFAGTPLRMVIDHFSWRGVMLAAALVSFANAAAIWVFVRDTPDCEDDLTRPLCAVITPQGKPVGIISGVFAVLGYRNTVLLFIIPGTIVGAVLTFCGLWGVPFLVTHHGLSTSRAAALTSAMLVAWAVAGPVFGWFSDRIGRRKPLYIIGGIVTVLGWAVAVLWHDLPLLTLAAVLLVTGFSSGCMIISFAFAKESVPAVLGGTVSGVVNMGVMSGPMIMQPFIGWILDRYWTGTLVDGIRQYSYGAYQAGFGVMIAAMAVGLVLLLFTRETRCRQLE